MFIIHRSNVVYSYWKIPRTEERHITKTFDNGGVIELISQFGEGSEFKVIF